MAKFLNSFEKEAGIGSEIGKTIGAPLGFAKRQVSSGLARGAAFRREVASGTKAGFKGQSQLGSAKKGVGGNLGDVRVKKMEAAHADDARAAKAGLITHPVLSGDVAATKAKAKEDVLKRARKINAKPSFAQRHPYATAGGAFLAGKALFEPKKEDSDNRPAVLYPQGN